jgi:hypothetical protein
VAHEHIQGSAMTNIELTDMKNRLHQQRCSCFLLSSTVLQLAVATEDKGAEEARLLYGLASVLKDIGDNLETIITDLETEQ